MNEHAYQAIEDAWQSLVKVRALCPSANDSMIGSTEYESPSWYKAHGVTYFVRPQSPLTMEGLKELRQMTAFINRSFIIVMAAILESYEVVPYRTDPDTSINGSKHIKLVKWLRNRFAHGEFEYDKTNERHLETRQLMEELLPVTKKPELAGFPAAIDSVLEPLKDSVLKYISAI